MGENWMLCNGETIDAGQLIELKSIMTPFQYLDFKTMGNSYSVTGISSRNYMEKHGDNIILIVRYYNSGTSKDMEAVFVSANGGIDWKRYDTNYDYNTGNVQTHSRPLWDGDKWVMLSSCSGKNPCLWVQTYSNTTSNRYGFSTASAVAYGFDLKKTDSGFYYGYANIASSYIVFFYGTDIENLSQAVQGDIHTSSYSVLDCFYDDGVYYFYFANNSGSGSNRKMRSTQDFITFDTITFNSSPSPEVGPNKNSIFCITQNKKAIYLSFSNSSFIYKTIYDYSQKTIENVHIPQQSGAIGGASKYGKVAFVNGEYVFTCYQAPTTSDTRVSIYKSLDLENFEYIKGPTVNYYLYGTTQEGNLLYCGATVNGSDCSAKQILLYDEAVILPNITSDKTYNYIKVK